VGFFRPIFGHDWNNLEIHSPEKCLVGTEIPQPNKHREVLFSTMQHAISRSMAVCFARISSLHTALGNIYELTMALFMVFVLCSYDNQSQSYWVAKTLGARKKTTTMTPIIDRKKSPSCVKCHSTLFSNLLLVGCYVGMQSCCVCAGMSDVHILTCFQPIKIATRALLVT